MPKRQEFPEHIIGDPAEWYNTPAYDTRGALGGPRGATAKHAFSNMCEAHPEILYGDLLLQCDLYRDPASGELTLHLYCPRCHNMLKISSKDKQMEWDPERGITIERFGCTWELNPSDNPAQHFGMSLCNWTVVVNDGVARDAR